MMVGGGKVAAPRLPGNGMLVWMGPPPIGFLHPSVIETSPLGWDLAEPLGGDTSIYESLIVAQNPPAMQETRLRSMGQEDALEKVMATHSSILAWKIPCAEEPGELQSMGSQRVRHD